MATRFISGQLKRAQLSRSALLLSTNVGSVDDGFSATFSGFHPLAHLSLVDAPDGRYSLSGTTLTGANLVAGIDDIAIKTTLKNADGDGLIDRFELYIAESQIHVPTPTAPEAPTLGATAGDGQVTLMFTDGNTGGSPIIGHELWAGGSSGAESLIGTITTGSPYVDTRPNGAAVYYKLKAVNQAGLKSPFSNEVSATPQAPVVQPRVAQIGVNPLTVNYSSIVTYRNLARHTPWRRSGLPDVPYETRFSGGYIDAKGNLLKSTTGEYPAKYVPFPTQVPGTSLWKVSWDDDAGALAFSGIQNLYDGSGYHTAVTDQGEAGGRKYARFTLTVDAQHSTFTSEGLCINWVGATGPNGGVRNVMIEEVNEDGSPKYAGVFDQGYVNYHKQFGVLRMMDLQATNNGPAHFVPFTWDQRTPPDHVGGISTNETATLTLGSGNAALTWSGINGLAVLPGEDAKQNLASRTLSGSFSTDDMLAVAHSAGANGNKIKVAIAAPAASASIAFTGKFPAGVTATITPKTGQMTANDIAALWNAHTYASGLLTIAVGGDGTGQVATTAATALAGGSFMPCPDQIALEDAVTLCNACDADLWWCFKAMATQDYITKAIQYVQANLKPGLKLYTELGNEIWNSPVFFNTTAAFQVMGYAFVPEATGTGANPGDPINSGAYYGYSFLYNKLVRALAANMPNDRYVRVGTVLQVGSIDAIDATLKPGVAPPLFISIDGTHPAMDVVAEAPYWDNPVRWQGTYTSGANYVAGDTLVSGAKAYVSISTFTASTASADAASGKMIELTDTRMLDYLKAAIDAPVGSVAASAAHAAQIVNDRGAPVGMAFYEGGFNLDFTDGQNDATFSARFDDFMTGPVMKRLEGYCDSELFRLIPGAVYCKYNSFNGAPYKGSFNWGLTENQWILNGSRYLATLDAIQGIFPGYFAGTPAIAGSPLVGSTLNATGATPVHLTGVTTQWIDTDNGNAVVATGSSWTATSTYAGHHIAVRMTGLDHDGQAVAAISSVPVLIQDPASIWTPASLGAHLLGWFTASDAGTLDVDGDGKVASWASKGVTNAAMGASGSRPVYNSAAIDGSPAVVFDGTDALSLSDISRFPTGDADIGIGFVGTAANADFRIIASYGDGDDRGSFKLMDASGLEWWQVGDQFNGGETWDAGGRLIVGFYRHSDSQFIFTRQGESPPVANTVTAPMAFGRGAAKFGAGVDGADNAVCTIREVVWFDQALSDADRQKLEGYLAWANGMASSLPADHPYKLVRP